MTASPLPIPRKAGRPPKRPADEDTRPLLSREAVVEAAYMLCATVRLDDLTLNQVAEALGVSTTTVRHHIKTRRSLTKLLVDRYFKELRGALPPLSGDWSVDLDNFLHAQTSLNSSKPGFPAFFFEHRFSPEIEPFGTEDALFVSGRMLHILRSAGLSSRHVAIAWHMAMHLLLSIGYAESRGLTPIDQSAVFERIGAGVARDSEDRAVLSAMGQVGLPIIYFTLSSLLKHAIAEKFAFLETSETFAVLEKEPDALQAPPRKIRRRA